MTTQPGRVDEDDWLRSFEAPYNQTARGRVTARTLLPNYDNLERAALAHMSVDVQRACDIEASAQGTDAWHDARRDRFTGSCYNRMAGGCRFSNSERSLRDLLWYKSISGNADMARGHQFEPHARDLYLDWRLMEYEDGRLQLRPQSVDEKGIIVLPQRPWMGYSPDGIVHDGDGKMQLIEIKAPRKIKPQINPDYMAQMQGGMWLLKQKYGEDHMQYCDFVQAEKACWHDPCQECECYMFNIKVERVPYNDDYARRLVLNLSDKWLNEYLPRMVMRDANLLERGRFDPVTRVNL